MLTYHRGIIYSSIVTFDAQRSIEKIGNTFEAFALNIHPMLTLLGTVSKPMDCPGVPSPQGDKRQLSLCSSCSGVRQATPGLAGTNWSNPQAVFNETGGSTTARHPK